MVNGVATETLTCSLYRYRLGNDGSIHLSYRRRSADRDDLRNVPHLNPRRVTRTCGRAGSTGASDGPGQPGKSAQSLAGKMGDRRDPFPTLGWAVLRPLVQGTGPPTVNDSTYAFSTLRATA